MGHRRRLALALAACVLAGSACSDDDVPAVAAAEVGAGTVVQTVAAPATIEARNRVTVTAPVGGEVAELLVGDGDEVDTGDPMVRLRSDDIDLQIEQARAAVAAADALGGVQGGPDLSPLVAGVRGQLDAVLPPLLDTLREQIEDIEDDQLRQAARDRVSDAEIAYRQATARLAETEQQVAAQAQAATASQRAAAEAQRRQAELALEAAEGRADELVVTAPAPGVVELARGDAGAQVPALPGLPSQDGEEGDLGGLLEGERGAGADGPVAEGRVVSPGQALLTVFDLSGFHVSVEVDELDAVDVSAGQTATVRVDAFPDRQIPARVERVAIEPQRARTGSVAYPVDVELTQDPGVPLRVGLTASVEIVVREVDAETTVPSSALLRRGGQEVVYRIVDDVVEEISVRVTAIGDDTAAVEGDLEPGDRVAVEQVAELDDGQPVVVAP